jgi:peptidoglycan/LPS O-acetylase OafA/YrhL
MGIIRLCLAFSVLLWHLGPLDSGPWVVNGYVAGISFFIISGFYMGYILQADYRSAIDFYKSRVLRLFPAYLAVFCVTALFWFFAGIPAAQIIGLYQPIDGTLKLTVALSNVAIVGLDLVTIVQNYIADWHLMRLVPPAWTLAVEIQFYLMAPLLSRLSLGALAGVAVIAIAVRLSLIGVAYDPWRYYFAPADFAFFIIGFYGQRLTAKYVIAQARRRIGVFLAAALPVIAVFGGATTVLDLDDWHLWIYYAFLAAATPFIFEMTKRSVIDRFLGNLSYPLYLVHTTLFAGVLLILGEQPVMFADVGGRLHEHGLLVCTLAVLATLLVALVLEFSIIEPVDRLRARYRAHPIGAEERARQPLSSQAPFLSGAWQRPGSDAP